MTLIGVNPLNNAKENVDAMLALLVEVAGGNIAKGVQVTARDALVHVIDSKPSLSMIDVVESFEQIPLLKDFAGHLRKAALPGAYGQFFEGAPEVDMHDVLKERFEAGQGVVQLLPNMPDIATLSIIQYAAQFGKPFMVIPSAKS